MVCELDKSVKNGHTRRACLNKYEVLRGAGVESVEKE